MMIQKITEEGALNILKDLPKELVLAIIDYRAFTTETLRKAVKEWEQDAAKAEDKYGHISFWDTSKVTDMSRLFIDMENFNEDISHWDVSNVTNMKCMFENASSFNQPIGRWKVSKVENMKAMFSGAERFNQPLADWNVSNVRRMAFMFIGATRFNHPLDAWDLSGLTPNNVFNRWVPGRLEG